MAKNAINDQIDTGVECHQKIRSIVKGIYIEIEIYMYKYLV